MPTSLSLGLALTSRRGGSSVPLSSQISALLGPADSFWLPGPQYFFSDASKLTPCVDLDPIQIWADASANARDWQTSSFAERPLARLIGGKWRARFDGTDDRVSGAGYPTADSDSYLMLGLTKSSNGQGTFSMTANANDNNSYVPFVDGNLYVAFGSTVRRDALVPSPTWSVGAGKILEVRGSATEHTVWLGGTQLFTTPTNTNPTWTSTPVLGGAAGSFSNADIAFMVYARQALNDTVRSSLTALLQPLLP